MKSKLSFAQRLQNESKSKEKSSKISSHSSDERGYNSPVQTKSKYMHFKEQHNELKNMLKLFQRQPNAQIIQEVEPITMTPLRTRVIDRRSNPKTAVRLIQPKTQEDVKQNFGSSNWRLSLRDPVGWNCSVVLPKSSPCIPEQRLNRTPVKEKSLKKGIPNIGNTCYINALVQCLFHLPHFNDYFQSQRYKGQTNGKGKDVVEMYRSLYMDVMVNRDSIEISTLPLKKSVSKICMLFMDWEQEDAHEFMKQLLNSIHQDLNRVNTKPKYKEISRTLEGYPLDKMASAYWDYQKSRDDSYIYDTLCGQIYSSIRCISCNHKSQCFENFLDLSLPMVPKVCSLQDLLRQFFQPEKLADYYLCQGCGKSSKKSTKTLQLWRVPRFLIIHLKRSQFTKKNNDPVKVNESLNLKPFIGLSSDKSARYCMYNLCGVIMHRGTMDGGHYWCLVKQSGRWFQIDDDTVSERNFEQVRKQLGQGSSAAYILFYSSLYS